MFSSGGAGFVGSPRLADARPPTFKKGGAELDVFGFQLAVADCCIPY